MGPKLSFDWYLLFVFLGIFQALLLTVLIYVKGRKTDSRFSYLSLFIFSLALVLTGVFLNYSGYILQIIRIDKYSLPVQFLIAPSLFLFIQKSLFPGRSVRAWIHYLPFLLMLAYFSLYFFQDQAVKYNVHIEEYGLDLESRALDSIPAYDPLGLHSLIHVLVFSHLLIYGFFMGRIIWVRFRESSVPVFNMKASYLNQYRNLFFYYLLALIFMAFLIVRYFWLGDFVFSLYLTAIIFLISLNISYRSFHHYFRNKHPVKYASSGLSDDDKTSILHKIKQVAEDEEFYCLGNASLEELSQRIHVSKHYVSQVINEMLGKNFFEYLAGLRIEKSRSLLSDPRYHNLTIDEISFMVGYHSRSAFNRVFKSITGTTPAEYRRKHS